MLCAALSIEQVNHPNIDCGEITERVVREGDHELTKNLRMRTITGFPKIRTDDHRKH